jgi:hypothetical protein
MDGSENFGWKIFLGVSGQSSAAAARAAKSFQAVNLLCASASQRPKINQLLYMSTWP